MRPRRVSSFPETYVTIELEPDGDEVHLVLTHRPILLKEYEGRTMMGWHTLLDGLVAVAAGREPEARDVAMERNRVLYGVEKFTRPVK